MNFWNKLNSTEKGFVILIIIAIIGIILRWDVVKEEVTKSFTEPFKTEQKK